jgi:hypothetical protein
MALRLSLRNRPWRMASAVVGCASVWGLHRRFFQVPYWTALPVLGVAVGNTIDIIYRRWLLRRLGSSET